MLKPCTALGCDRLADGARGLCDMHYRRWQRQGDPNRRLSPAKKRNETCPKCGGPWEQIGERFGCRKCNRERVLEFQKNNPALVNERQRNWKAQVLPNGWTRGKVRKMWERYQITFDDYMAMFVEQGGRCAICSKEPDSLFIDHDHASGRTRALLCKSCNFAIGLLGDDPERIRAAAAYVEKHRAA